MNAHITMKAFASTTPVPVSGTCMSSHAWVVSCSFWSLYRIVCVNGSLHTRSDALMVRCTQDQAWVVFRFHSSKQVCLILNYTIPFSFSRWRHASASFAMFWNVCVPTQHWFCFRCYGCKKRQLFFEILFRVLCFCRLPWLQEVQDGASHWKNVVVSVCSTMGLREKNRSIGELISAADIAN